MRGITGALLLVLLAACTTVPITGRQQLNFIPDSQLLSMSFQNYQEFLKEHKPITDSDEAQLVRRVGERIQKSVERYFADRRQADKLKGYKWEFNLVENKALNAWCMPGGKVVVYTGLLPVTKDETGLAVVMGHEVAHAIANHGGERMSQNLVVALGGQAAALALETQGGKGASQAFQAAYGLGTQVGILLPFSRSHEAEADNLGLIFMAMAGYDPNQAVPFWERMAAQMEKEGKNTPEFLRTHPSDKARVANIRRRLPEALKHYKP